MQSYFNNNTESFIDYPGDIISKVAKQELTVDKVKNSGNIRLLQ